MGDIVFFVYIDSAHEFLSIGRNGAYTTTGIEVMARTKPGNRQEIVDLTGINSKGNPAKGDIQISPEAMDELCYRWIASRGTDFTFNLQELWHEQKIKG